MTGTQISDERIAQLLKDVGDIGKYIPEMTKALREYPDFLGRNKILKSTIDDLNAKLKTEKLNSEELSKKIAEYETMIKATSYTECEFYKLAFKVGSELSMKGYDKTFGLIGAYFERHGLEKTHALLKRVDATQGYSLKYKVLQGG